MSTPDVNAGFDGTKLDQIQRAENRAADVARRVENGELRSEGNGLYTVMTGIDRGERLRLSSSGDIMGEHGLDTLANGSVALYSRQQEWFGLGQIVPDGLDDIHEVLRLIGGELEYSKEQAFYKDKMTGALKPIPNTFAAVWMDADGKNETMGTVGKVYKHAQDVKAAEFTLDLIGEQVVWESVGRMQNNARFFAGLRLREDMVIDPSGIADGIKQYLYLINSHDGSGKLTFVVTPWRIRCRNTERFAVRDAMSKWGVRHTANWDSEARKAEARLALGLTSQYYASWHAEEEKLLAQKITGIEKDKFWTIVESLCDQGTWAKPEEAKGRSATIYSNRMDRLGELLGENTRQLGNNLYAAERAVTQYIDHESTRRTSLTWGDVDVAEARQGIALLGNDDDKKARLHSGLLTLART